MKLTSTIAPMPAVIDSTKATSAKASRAIAKGLEHMVTASGEEIVAKADKIKSLVDAGGKASGFGEEEQGKTLVVSLEFLRNLDPTQERVVEDSKVIELPDAE